MNFLIPKDTEFYNHILPLKDELKKAREDITRGFEYLWKKYGKDNIGKSIISPDGYRGGISEVLFMYERPEGWVRGSDKEKRFSRLSFTKHKRNKEDFEFLKNLHVVSYEKVNELFNFSTLQVISGLRIIRSPSAIKFCSKGCIFYIHSEAKWDIPEGVIEILESEFNDLLMEKYED